MKKILILVLSCVLLLVGCGGGEEKKVVNVYNWGEYIDKDILAEFEEQTGITVKYDTFVTNEDMYVKLKKGGSSFDLLVPSDYMIEKLIKEDLLAEVDFSKIPNFENLDPELLHKSYDPEDKYSVPYFWGTLGIVYNKTMVSEPVDSWDILWDEKYANQILMLDSSRDSIGIALIKSGYSINSMDEGELAEAKELLIQQKPLTLAYQVDQSKDMMVGEEAAIAVMYSGDAYDAVRQNPNLEYVIPKEGSNLWFDACVIPKDAENKENAELFINFLLDPEIAMRNADYVGYSTPNAKAKDLLSEEMKGSLIAYPDLSKHANMEVFNDPGEMITVYDQIWTDVLAN